ncbi:branched-chain amino acid aminotransferase, cytosolic [Aspergillus ruber CBS 135680]|uniref:Branched-chain-amino-acid aminotransferase n=1 Tax=Aspergillus ruber (strain CBS 135680) TaxID=1388766 RepID=A0A017S0H6_ASPRC|nr:cytosolic branched-chain amino acid aminotransferase [Aspergillus ruber CBS 135680]EYE90452.1 cytosolic branched-chain amino acid aminotransferase [Aspergillus ruber CBS 135680]
MGSITPDLDASTINFTPSTSLRPVPAIGSPEEKSHSYCTDHMVTVRWTVESGWQTPEVRPFENLSIPPTASCLHYATECFEGMKAYRGYDGKLRLFRPDCNGERLANSAVRTSLPGFAPGEVKKLVGRLLQIDGPRWLPKDQPGRYLYIRPTVIGNGTQLGVQAPKEALLFIIAVPWPDMSSKPSGLKLLASTPDTIRAWPGGFGYAKLGANYGPSLAAHGVATGQGFDQVLWLFGGERQVTEAGASNFFIVWEGKDGKRELVTASLESQVILPGVTRRSVLELARERLASPSATGLPPVDVVERPFTIGEVEEAWKEGRIIEAFVSGTAYFIAPVQIIRNGDVDMNMLEAGVERAGYAAQVKSWLGAIMFGKEEHEWGYVIENEDGQ